MRKFLVLAAAGFLLAGCVTDNLLPSPIVGGGTNATISTVQKVAIDLCAFEPTAETVAQVLSSSAIITTAEVVARAICKAATTNVQAEGNVPGRYVSSLRTDTGKLVIVKGRFVKKTKLK